MKKRLWVVAALAAAAGTIVLIASRHSASAPSGRVVQADALAARVVVPFDERAALRALREADVPVEDVAVHVASDVVILKGTGSPDSARQAEGIVRTLGAKRVANLIQPPKGFDDGALRRAAERELAALPSLELTRINVTSENGIVTIRGTVERELQKDLVRQSLRNLSGAREVRVELTAM